MLRASSSVADHAVCCLGSIDQSSSHGAHQVTSAQHFEQSLACYAGSKFAGSCEWQTNPEACIAHAAMPFFEQQYLLRAAET